MATTTPFVINAGDQTSELRIYVDNVLIATTFYDSGIVTLEMFHQEISLGG